jgi:hypothetical protein
MKLKGLGRGLDALLAGNENSGKEQQRMLLVGCLQPGKYQPRNPFWSVRSVSDQAKTASRSWPASAAGAPRRWPV